MKTKLIIIFILFFSLIISNIYSQEINKNLFYQPFDILFDSNSFHVMLFFKNHKEYESIEFMIKENIDKKNLIRGIITRHDGSQIDYFNDEEIVKEINKNNYLRETYYSSMYYKRDIVDSKTYINIKFKTIKNENIDFIFHAASELSSKYGGIIDPGEHSKNSSLPIMYREKSTLAGPKSKISIDGKSYEIPVKVNIPVFFKGLEGYYSESFDMLIFKPSKRILNSIKIPEKLQFESEWKYKEKGKEITYKIFDIKQNFLIIKSKNEEIKALLQNGVFYIEYIKGYLNITNKEFLIKFDPYLPIPSNIENNLELNISGKTYVYLNNLQLFSANVNIEKKEKNIFLIKINPIIPEWAKKRNIFINIEIKGFDILINSSIVE